MSLLPEITSRSITLAGGLLATSAAVIAQGVANDTAVGTGSFLLGGAGLIAAISAFTKDYWSDRQKQRDHQIAMLRIKLRACRTCNALHELYNWARNAHTAVPTLPPVPELHFEGEIGATGEGPDTENPDA
jgi:hypothetical protein